MKAQPQDSSAIWSLGVFTSGGWTRLPLWDENKTLLCTSGSRIRIQCKPVWPRGPSSFSHMLLLLLLLINNILCAVLCNLRSHIPISVTQHFKNCCSKLEMATPIIIITIIYWARALGLGLVLKAISVSIHVVSMTALGSLFYYFHFTKNDSQSTGSY